MALPTARPPDTGQNTFNDWGLLGTASCFAWMVVGPIGGRGLSAGVTVNDVVK